MNWRRRLRFYLLKFLRLKDMPSKAALGFAVGACVNLYPAFGISVGVAVFLAGLVRANLAAGLLGNLIMKPLFPVMFYLNLWVGNKLVGHGQSNLAQTLAGLLHMHWQAFVLVGKAFFLGAAVNSLVLGTILFLVVYRIFCCYRRRMIRFVLAQKLI